MYVTIGSHLDYEVDTQTAFIFQIEAVRGDGQNVVSESLQLPEGCRFDSLLDPITHNRIIRILTDPGPLSVRYEARVQTPGIMESPGAVSEIDFMYLPAEVIRFLAPSRYCPSDTFTEFAFSTFGGITMGHTRVMAVCDWVFNHLRYQAGSTGPNDSAADVFHGRAGVCRDFAHLAISLCRALGIPARYTSVYAADLEPQDFHATFQAYLRGPNGGAWYMFDPTRTSSVDAVARIAAGRDAADVSFAWPQGAVTFKGLQVWANVQGRTTQPLTTAAVPTLRN